jgi:hypothetical protein
MTQLERSFKTLDFTSARGNYNVDFGWLAVSFRGWARANVREIFAFHHGRRSALEIPPVCAITFLGRQPLSGWTLLLVKGHGCQGHVLFGFAAQVQAGDDA